MTTIRNATFLGLAGLLMCSGCGDWNELMGAPSDVSDEVTEGTYEGELTIEIRVFAGPVRVKHLTCGQPLDLLVGEKRDDAVHAEVACEDFDAVLEGTLMDDMSIDGTLSVDGMELDWDGWFYDPQAVYGEAAGELNESGLRIEYVMYVDAVLTDASL